MTKTDLLEKRIKFIKKLYIEEIDALPTRGPRGGRNAANIPGWIKSPHGTISKICRDLNIAANHWDGHRRTPATSIPECINDECIQAYNRVFCADIS